MKAKKKKKKKKRGSDKAWGKISAFYIERAWEKERKRGSRQWVLQQNLSGAHALGLSAAMVGAASSRESGFVF